MTNAMPTSIATNTTVDTINYLERQIAKAQDEGDATKVCILVEMLGELKAEMNESSVCTWTLGEDFPRARIVCSNGLKLD